MTALLLVMLVVLACARSGLSVKCWVPSKAPNMGGQGGQGGRWAPPVAAGGMRAGDLHAPSETPEDWFTSQPPPPPHPRLRLNNTALAALKATIVSDPVARGYYVGLQAAGEAMLSETLVPCGAGADMLGSARTVLGRSYTLGLLHRLQPEETRFAARATAELLHVTTNCTTWDPFGLVLAEMTHAVAIGFDWLHDVLTPSQRSVIIGGVTRLGFAEALRQYAQGAFWTRCTFNWGIVTNGGLTVGALAFLEEAPGNTSAVLAQAALGLPCGFGSFAPEGGWHEGPMYWQYVAEYSHAVIEALRGVYGHDHGLAESPGYNETALFRLHMNGPSQTPFNFGDSVPSLNNSAAGYFLGYGRIPTSSPSAASLFSYEGRRLADIISGGNGTSPPDRRYDCTVLDCARLLLEYSAAGSHALLEEEPTARVFRLSAFGWGGRKAVGFFRSAWGAADDGTAATAAWIGFKAANGVPNHNDLDGGTFVFEAGGERWAVDLGAESYNMPGYWTQTKEQRYSYYRKSTAGHNTLTFDNNGHDWSLCDQDPTAAGITEVTLFAHGANASDDARFSASPSYAIVDLTAAYRDQGAVRVERGFAFTAGYAQLVVVDEFVFAANASVSNVTWAMHTLAAVDTHGASARLSQNGARLHAAVVAPAHDATLSAHAVNLEPPQYPTPGITRLQLQLPAMETAGGRIVVSLSLDPGAAAATPEVLPLARWAAKGPFAA